jgi:membrane fusion protein, multidrug efflux system
MVIPPRALSLTLALAAAATLLAGCGREAESARKAAAPPAVLISTALVQPRTLEVYEEVVGSLENVFDPKIGAEVAGRVTRVLGRTGMKVRKGALLAEIDAQDFEIQSRGDRAEIARLASLLAQQDRVLERQEKLVGQGFITQNAAEDARAQRDALREQLAAARVRAEATGRSLGKTRVLAPIDGEIELQIVAPGDYVKVCDPLFNLVGMQLLRAHLLFPEAAAERIRPGLRVLLSSPAAPERTLEARIEDIKPTVGTANRALDAIVRFSANGRPFRGGGSVNARVVLAVKADIIVVPEQSVVLRPVGKVVYAIREGRAEQRVVETGLRQDGVVEVLKGLAPGEVVAVDGAGFLTHGAAVSLPKPKPAPGAGAKAS